MMANYVLGISAYYHDSAACLLKDGEIVGAAQEERFTRIKHDASFPKNAIDFCLDSANIKAKELKLVAFYDRPRPKFGRIVSTYLDNAPKGFRTFMQAVPLWLGGKLWLENEIKRELGCDCQIESFEHHDSHAASAFFPSPYERSAIMTIDGVGEWATSSYGIGEKSNFELLSEIRFPHSLGLLYSAFTSYLGFKVNSGEYKVMGLAPYGKPVYAKLIMDKLVDLKDDGSFALNLDFFNYQVGSTMTSSKFHKLFQGDPRQPESPLNQKNMDLASSIQTVIEEIVMRMAIHVRKMTDINKLCLAGGVSLNCVSNGKLLRSGLFDKIWIQPAAGDAGGALGAAYLAHCRTLGGQVPKKNGRDLQKGSYLGSSYSNEEIQQFLNGKGWKYTEFEREALLDFVVEKITEGMVIGWFQGRMEFGPRALGARSIIGDARSPDMQKKINLKIKFRESFRPFAPSVLSSEVSSWFDLDGDSPYMLLVTQVAKDKQVKSESESADIKGLEKLSVVRSSIPAVTHVDFSARVQTVNEYSHPIYHDLIKKFFQKTGCPVIVNTSFNVRGEPIVESPEQAYTCFMRTEMDILVLGNNVLLKEQQKEFVETRNWKEEFSLD